MANIWREPIFDRTSTDVAFALRKISEWKQSHTHRADITIENNSVVIKEGETDVTGDSVVLQTDGMAYVENEVLYAQLGCVYDLKGCLNLSDITRIEDDISYLTMKLTQYNYPVSTHNKEWSNSGLPTALDMKRIGDNVRNLFKGFILPDKSDALPEVILSYKDINALEHNLHLLKQLLDVMESLFIKSGTIKCGSTNRLPIRR